MGPLLFLRRGERSLGQRAAAAFHRCEDQSPPFRRRLGDRGAGGGHQEKVRGDRSANRGGSASHDGNALGEQGQGGIGAKPYGWSVLSRDWVERSGKSGTESGRAGQRGSTVIVSRSKRKGTYRAPSPRCTSRRKINDEPTSPQRGLSPPRSVICLRFSPRWFIMKSCSAFCILRL